MTDAPNPKPDPKTVPTLFATIHFQSDERPDGYTEEDIAALNALANADKTGSPE